MAPHYRNPETPTLWEAFAIIRIAFLALIEVVWGLFTWPFVLRTEDVALSYIRTKRNQELIDACPALKTFSCSPWAIGPHAQTFFSVIKLGTRPMPRKELVTMPDGVQITLLWFEPKIEVAEDAPVVVSLHGIGGDENSVRPITLAQECLLRGWRSVLYVRRGHGNSSLLPVTTTVAAADVATDSGKAAEGKGEQDAAALNAGEPTAATTAGCSANSPQIAAAFRATDNAAVNVTAARAAAVAAPAMPAAVAPLDFPCPPTSPPLGTTVTIITTDGGAAVGGDVNRCSPDSPASGCMEPKSMKLPLLGGGSGGIATTTTTTDTQAGVAAGVVVAASADTEALRRTRKAFPQHADTEDLQVVLRHIRAARPLAPIVAVGFSMGSNVLVKFLGEHSPGAAPSSSLAPSTEAALGPDSPPGSAGAVAGAGCGCGVGVEEGEGRRAREHLGDPMSSLTKAAAAAAATDDDLKNPLAAAVSVSNGYDIIEGTRHLVSHRRLADRIITAALHKLLRRKLPEVHAICAAHGLLVDFDEVLACSTIRDFERALMLPICGYSDLDEYYRHNNCCDALMNVSTPLLCLSARDDPIIDPSLLRHAEAATSANPHVMLAVTRRGGHLGWLQGWNGRSWMMDVIVQFVDAVARVQQVHASGGNSGAVTAASVCSAGGDASSPITNTVQMPMVKRRLPTEGAMSSTAIVVAASVARLADAAHKSGNGCNPCGALGDDGELRSSSGRQCIDIATLEAPAAPASVLAAMVAPMMAEAALHATVTISDTATSSIHTVVEGVQDLVTMEMATGAIATTVVAL